MLNKNLLLGRRQKLHIINGISFLGWFLAIPDTTRVTNMLHPRRLLQVKPECPVHVGDVISNSSGTMYICADHGEGWREVPIYRQFKLYQVDQIYPWKRATITTDTLTGLKKSTGSFTSLGSAYCSIEPASPERDAFKIPEAQAEIVTSSAIQLGDILGPWEVVRVDQQLGVYSATVK